MTLENHTNAYKKFYFLTAYWKRIYWEAQKSKHMMFAHDTKEARKKFSDDETLISIHDV